MVHYLKVAATPISQNVEAVVNNQREHSRVQTRCGSGIYILLVRASLKRLHRMSKLRDLKARIFFLCCEYTTENLEP